MTFFMVTFRRAFFSSNLYVGGYHVNEKQDQPRHLLRPGGCESAMP